MERTTKEPTLIDATCCLAFLEGYLNVLKATTPEVDVTPALERIYETLPDVFAKKADTNRKPLPRPVRRPKVNPDAPICFLPTCDARGMAWPTGKNVPTMAETVNR